MGFLHKDLAAATNAIKNMWGSNRVGAAGQHQTLSENEQALRIMKDEDHFALG